MKRAKLPRSGTETEQIDALEKALRASTARFRSIIENNRDGMLVVNRKGKIRFANAAASTMLERPTAELVGEKFGFAIANENVEGVQLLRADGSCTTAELRVAETEWEGEAAYIVSLRDVTERRRAEERLRASEERFRALVENSLDGIALADPDGTIRYASPGAARIVGLTPQQMIGRSTFAGIHPEDRERAQQIFARVVENPNEAIFGQFRYRHKDGSWRWVEGIATNLLRVPGVNALLANYRDITERKAAEEQIARRAQDFAALYDFGLALNQQLDPHAQFETFFKIVGEAFGAQRVSFFRYHPSDRTLQLEFEFGTNPRSDGQTDGRISHEDENTFIGFVARERVPYRVADLSADPRWHYSQSPLRASLSVPVEHERKLLGVLSVLAETADAYSADHERLLTLFANQIAVALENGRLFDEARQRVAELETINRISIALRQAETFAGTLECLLNETLAALDTNAGGIYLHDPERGTVRQVTARGWVANAPDSIKLESTVARSVFIKGESFRVDAFQRDLSVRPDVRSNIPSDWGGAIVPLSANENIFGAMVVSVQLPRTLQSAEVNLLVTLAAIGGTALQRARLASKTDEQLERLNTLRAVDNAIISSLDLRVTLDVVVQHIVSQLGVDAAAILLAQSDGYTLEYGAGRGFRTREIEATHVRFGEGLAGRVALSREGIEITDARRMTIQNARPALFRKEGFLGYRGVPLVVKGRTVGTLEIFQRTTLEPDEDWMNYLRTLAGQAAIAIDNGRLFEDLQRSNVELTLAYDHTLEGWSRALDLRDKETEGHTQRTAETTLTLARAMNVDSNELMQIWRGALLHDIGKMGIPDTILFKEGPLTDEEWAIMRQHPVYAYQMLSPIEYLRSALDIPYCHHEKWNGMGYPRGLRGEEIPVAARIFAVVDVWDALRHDRPYRKAWGEEQVQEYLRAQAGIHFDPSVVETFLALSLDELKHT